MSESSITKDFQKAAKEKGLYTAKLDGDPGPLTVSALLQWFCPGDKKIPAWMIYAAQELGVSELYGNRNNPRIIHYHSFTELGADSDEVAWCSSFVNAALLEGAGIQGTRSASAASFKTYGKSVAPTQFGAIVLFKTNTGSKRHVAFNCGTWKGYNFILGGNQSDAVTINVRPVSDVSESRYPII